MAEKHIKRTEVRVRYAETDQMGVVYYANYFVWMEVARTEFIREMGLPYKELEDVHNIILPVAKAHVNYKSPAKYDDVIEIESHISELKKVSFRIDHKMYNRAEDRLVATAYTVHPFVSKEGGVMRLPDDLMKYFTAVYDGETD